MPDAGTPDASVPLFTGTISFAGFGNDGFTHVFLVHDDGGIVQLTTGPHDDETPEWSFDGARLTFQRSDPDGLGVYVMNVDGSDLKRLSPTPGRDLLPGFTPDGSKIVFTNVVDPTGCNVGAMPSTAVMTMNASDGTNRATIVDPVTAPTCFNVEPRASPDGTTFALMCGPSNGSIQICTVAVDGSGFTFLTTTSGTVGGDPHWSWDSQTLGISHRDLSGNVNVWTLRADGSDLVQLTHFTEPMEGGDVGWSLDDSQVVFEQDDGGAGQSDPNAPAVISIIGADGGGYASLGVPCSDKGCAPRFRPH